MPKIFEVNTANEYWRSDGALVHFDPTTGAELAIPPEVRIYALAGCQHGPGMPLLTNRSILNPEQHAANPLSMLNYTSVMRAALVNIEAWVCEGIEPPPSALPNSSNGTSAEAGDVLRTIAAIAGATAADQALMRTAPAIVSAVDGDGNETAGIRLPEVAVPAATYIGWNVRHPETGGVGQMADMVGSTIPFARTAAERAATGDLRPSLEERYESREAYVELARRAAASLAAERWLLPDDMDRAVGFAARLYDQVAKR